MCAHAFFFWLPMCTTDLLAFPYVLGRVSGEENRDTPENIISQFRFIAQPLPNMTDQFGTANLLNNHWDKQ